VYLSTLQKRGYLLNDEGTYRLSLKFLYHAGEIRSRSELYQTAKSGIDDLARETGEVANLAVEEDGMRVILYGSEGKSAMWDDTAVGDYAHMHLTATGKAMLAHLPVSRVEEIVKTHGLPEATPHTITDEETLFDALSTIRERGYSIEDEEHKTGIRAIGVPILLDDESVIGAVSVVGPKSRLSDQETESELVDQLVEKTNVMELQYEHY
jgi:DNA-binding IclR family transcriptional regulator